MWLKEQFEFMNTACAQTRYVIAAHHLIHCEHIIEIGGFQDTIDQYVTHHPTTITVVDPLINPRQWVTTSNTEVQYIQSLYQTVDFSFVPNQVGKKGLLFMGFTVKENEDISGPNDTLQTFRQLIPNMNVVIMETMIRESPGYQNFEKACTTLESCGFQKITEHNFEMKHDSKFVPNEQFVAPRVYRLYEK